MSEQLNPRDLDRVIEMAWEDRTPFAAIEYQFGLTEADVIRLMKRELKLSSWKRWRKRVQGRKTKQSAPGAGGAGRFKSDAQRAISGNRPSKPR